MCTSTQDNQLTSATGRGKFLIALGLTIFIASAWLPDVPTLTALALVSLGATMVTIHRFGRHPARELLLAAHLAIYFALYLFMLGAIWHESATSLKAPWHLTDSLDLATSAGLMAAVVRASIGALRWQCRGPDATLL